MVAAVRLVDVLVARLLCVCFFFCQYQTAVSASPMATFHGHYRQSIFPRTGPIVNNSTGTVQVFDPTTNQPIPQSSASDGSGSQFSIPAIIWIAFCALIGIPLAAAGIRGWRLTTGGGIGLAAAVCSWASVINTVNATGLSDILIIAVVLSFFVLGFGLGVFEIGRVAGIALLGIIGGVAIGVRVVLLKPQLLFAGDNMFFLDWLIIGVFGLLSELALLWRQRVGITVSAASAGTFLSFLALDLIMNKQAGMSRGLRFLFDRNSSHLSDILQHGYNPPLSTQIVLAISLGLIPILACGQHRVFPQPFTPRSPPDPDLTSLNLDWEDRRITTFNVTFEKSDSVTKLKSGWDGTFKGISRFSL